MIVEHCQDKYYMIDYTYYKRVRMCEARIPGQLHMELDNALLLISLHLQIDAEMMLERREQPAIIPTH